jgi:peptide/nickel transport system permease protein
MTETLADEAAVVHEENPWARAWRRLKRRKGAMAALVVVVFLILLAVLAPWIAPYDPTKTSFGLVRKAPSWAHWFGTDEVGRDVLSRVIFGARASLSAGLVSVGIAVGVGVPLGLLAGYAGGWIDAILSRLVDAMLAIPFLILAIALSAFLGPSLSNAMIAIGVTATPVFVRLTRGQTLAAKVEDYVEAARAVGNPHWRIALRHVLPNIVPPLLVQASLAIAGAIIAEAALSFLGLGQQPPAPSWGSMLNTAQRFIAQAPWMAFWPGFAIFFAVLSFNLLGDGLRDALDPRHKKAKKRASRLAPVSSAGWYRCRRKPRRRASARRSAPRSASAQRPGSGPVRCRPGARHRSPCREPRATSGTGPRHAWFPPLTGDCGDGDRWSVRRRLRALPSSSPL